MTKPASPPSEPAPVLQIAPRPTLPTSSGGAFPVRRIYCIGRNYADHAAEMGVAPERTALLYFQKNPENADPSGLFPLPPGGGELHHEVELVVALASGGRDIPPERALSHVWGYGVGIDMTRRDIQAEAKRKGQPWEAAKAFERSAPIGRLHPVGEVGHKPAGRIALSINDTLRQEGDLNQMLWSLPELIAELSGQVALAAGDLIFTGTPAGVGPVARGDRIRAEIEGLSPLEVIVRDA